jgi:hypothetical protein
MRRGQEKKAVHGQEQLGVERATVAVVWETIPCGCSPVK